MRRREKLFGTQLRMIYYSHTTGEGGRRLPLEGQHDDHHLHDGHHDGHHLHDILEDIYGGNDKKTLAGEMLMVILMMEMLVLVVMLHMLVMLTMLVMLVMLAMLHMSVMSWMGW